jgi:hypothetical protein
MSGGIKLNLPSGGVSTLQAPDSASDSVITVPSGTSTLLATDGDGSGLTGLPSSGADTSLSNLSATGENKVCQAWVNFNGTGTVAIRDSYNVSSITDNGTGDYLVNFTNAMANVNYATNFNHDEASGWIGTSRIGSQLVGSTKLRCYTNAGFVDPAAVCAQVFGD